MIGHQLSENLKTKISSERRNFHALASVGAEL